MSHVKIWEDVYELLTVMWDNNSKKNQIKLWDARENEKMWEKRE